MDIPDINRCTHRIIGCGMRIHSTLGSGFQEKIYQRALEIEFKWENLEYLREVEIPIYYRKKHIGTRRVDFFVANTILLEIKAVVELNNAHLAQGKNYLEAFNLETGLLINFGGTSLQYKRLFNKKK